MDRLVVFRGLMGFGSTGLRGKSRFLVVRFFPGSVESPVRSLSLEIPAQVGVSPKDRTIWRTFWNEPIFTSRKEQNTASKQLRSTRKLNKPVEFDALVPFMKVWGSNSIG